MPSTEPPTIEHRPKPPIDKVIGGIGAIVVAVGLIWGLDWIEETLPYAGFIAICVAALCGLLLIGFLVDRRASARKAGRKSGRS